MTSLRFFEQSIEDPTTVDMLTFASAVAENIGVGAASVFEGIGQNGQCRKVVSCVNVPREGDNGGCSPKWIDQYWAERIANYVAEQFHRPRVWQHAKIQPEPRLTPDQPNGRTGVRRK